MIAVIDYGLGNLCSLSNSLSRIGAGHVVTADRHAIETADKLILPGVGAFRDGIARLRETGLADLIVRRANDGVPLLGICLGMQLLFDVSYEYGEHLGLGLLRGEIRSIASDLKAPLKVPHIGWNALNVHRPGVLTRYLSEGDCVYFVHSFYAKNIGGALVASAEYGIQIPAIVERANVTGAQFHPEKSGEVGLNMLRAFAFSGGKGVQNP